MSISQQLAPAKRRGGSPADLLKATVWQQGREPTPLDPETMISEAGSPGSICEADGDP